jgi:RNA polymerase-binding protein DksA
MNLVNIKKTLTKQRETLIERLEKMKSTNDVEEILNPDKTDLALESQNNDKEILLLDHAEQQLKEIDQALNRLKEDRYGICLDCGKNIQPARLEIIPSAAFCIKCQQKKDNK